MLSAVQSIWHLDPKSKIWYCLLYNSVWIVFLLKFWYFFFWRKKCLSVNPVQLVFFLCIFRVVSVKCWNIPPLFNIRRFLNSHAVICSPFVLLWQVHIHLHRHPHSVAWSLWKSEVGFMPSFRNRKILEPLQLCLLYWPCVPLFQGVCGRFLN